jgi:CheY-like chemotaxis protein
MFEARMLMSPATLPDRTSNPASVLLVEDEVVLRALLAETLRAAGFSVIEAANADEAWAYLEACAGDVDLLFSDVSMPGSMDGIALMKRVRNAFPSIKILITSGNLGPVDLNAFDGFVQKPFTLDHAANVAARMLRLEPPEPA